MASIPAPPEQRRVAITVWEGRISPVFDVCREIQLVTVAAAHVVASRKEELGSLSAQDKVERLAALGAQTLVCGAISVPLREALCVRGIEVIDFVAGEVAAVVAALLRHALPNPKLVMPGCGRNGNSADPSRRGVRQRRQCRQRGR